MQQFFQFPHHLVAGSGKEQRPLCSHYHCATGPLALAPSSVPLLAPRAATVTMHANKQGEQKATLETIIITQSSDCSHTLRVPGAVSFCVLWLCECTHMHSTWMHYVYAACTQRDPALGSLAHHHLSNLPSVISFHTCVGRAQADDPAENRTGQDRPSILSFCWQALRPSPTSSPEPWVSLHPLGSSLFTPHSQKSCSHNNLQQWLGQAFGEWVCQLLFALLSVFALGNHLATTTPTPTLPTHPPTHTHLDRYRGSWKLKGARPSQGWLHKGNHKSHSRDQMTRPARSHPGSQSRILDLRILKDSISSWQMAHINSKYLFTSKKSHEKRVRN